MVKLLLDTDIGSDIDDAVCLAYLLGRPDCELLGITTVSGEPSRRAALASALCRVAGRAVPIRPGAAEPLLIEQRQPRAPQADALARWPHDDAASFPRGEAVELLRQTIRQHPGEVTLLAIGPLTNVALLFRADPEIPALLAGLVIMGGSFGVRAGVTPLEWNAILDPHAAAIVYRTPVKLHRSIGLDVTTQVTMPADAVRRRFSSRLLRPVLDFAEVWFREREIITFHDPLAAATIFAPDVCTFQPGTVAVELTPGESLGRTHWTPGGEESPHQVAVDVDAGRFLDEYFRTVADAPA